MKKIIILNILLCSLIIITNSQVTYLETYYDNQGGFEGLKYPKDIAVSANYLEVFVIGNSRLTYFKTDESLQSFEYVDQYSYDSIYGLLEADKIVVAPNKRFYYVPGDRELLFFNKKDSTGNLTFMQSITDSDSVNMGFGVSTQIAISPDNRNLYLGAQYSTRSKLHIFKIDSLAGLLTYKNTIDDAGLFSYITSIACSYDNLYVYVCSHYSSTSDTSVCVFRRKTESDSLELIQKLTNRDGIFKPYRITLSNDNRFCYILDAFIDILVYQRDMATGMLVFKLKIDLSDFVEEIGSGHRFIMSKNNRNLYLLGSSWIHAFSVDSLTGMLSIIQSIKDNDKNISGFSELVSMELSNKDTILYAVSGSKIGKLFILKRDTVTGELTYIKKIENEQGKIKGLSNAVDLFVSHDNKYLYTLADGNTNIISIFNRLADGKLTFDKNIVWDELGPSIGAPNVFIQSPDSKYFFIGSKHMYGIRVLERDSVTGNLKFYKSYTNSGIEIEDESIHDIAIYPDADYLYVCTGPNIITYHIDTDNSDLSFNSLVTLGDNDTSGLKGYHKMQITNDGNNIYLCSFSNFIPDGISIFKRNGIDGTLTFIENITSHNSDFSIIRPYDILISPDDKNVYTIGESIHCFNRNLNDGSLELFDKINFENLGFDYSHNIYDAYLSKDGKSFIAVTNTNKLLLSFVRNLSNGKLILKEKIHFSDNFNYSIDYPRVYITNDLLNAYIISNYDRILSSYKVNFPIGFERITKVCGDEVTLEVEGGHQHYWSTSDTTSSIYVSAEGVYSVYVIDSIGREGWDSTEVQFNQPPIVNLGEDTTVYSFQSLYVTPDITGIGNYNYLWIDSSSNSYLLLDSSNLNLEDNLITLEVTDNNECENTDTIVVTVILYDSLNFNSNISFKLYPNPANNKLFIEYERPLTVETNLFVVNINGEELQRIQLGEYTSNVKLNFDKYSPGIYFIYIIGEDYTDKMKVVKY